ncbi:class I SAM-dependent methyltransferase [Hyphococcus sp.]|uniref:class I SAM-dependent methyltransferase n=1 Tax=Hyphococcus sp. TaxID=2038636 RepID=UPI0035C68F9C
MEHKERDDSLKPIRNDAAIALEAISLPKEASILDVGTGAGNFAIALALEGYDVLTGEPESDATHYARQNWQENAAAYGVQDKIRFQAFDASNMPFEKECFDAVFFFGVLHHVDEDKRAAVFSEALRVVKPNGAAVFFEPRHALLEKIWVDDPGHPLAADPSHYVDGKDIRERRFEGAMMDIFIYERANASA